MERCPCCNARVNGQHTCPRCQANLANVVSSGQQAQHLLEQAIQLWLLQEPILAVQTLIKAQSYQKTPAIIVFRDFLVRHLCQKVLALLADHNYSEAQHTLSLLQNLHPTHALIVQLQGFTHHLKTRSDAS